MQRFNGKLKFSVSYLGVIAVGLTFAGCQLDPNAGGSDQITPASKIELVERDVEAPEVFDLTEAALWDGRPSLGGIWVAHPDVKDPERVIIRNKGNGKFVIGALFRRERENAGPRLQLSSDAADALGILAGAPTNVSVTALRREAVADPVAPAETQDSIDAPADIAQEALDVVATAPVAAPAPSVPTKSTKDQPKPTTKAPAKKSSSVAKPYIQIGIFSVEQNAQNTAESMRQRGIVPLVKQFTTNGKTFWRVIVGPAGSADELKSLSEKVKKAGFNDAYAVSG